MFVRIVPTSILHRRPQVLGSIGATTIVTRGESAGLKYADVDVVYLSPAEGRAAFDKGAVDAWVIWEPYRTSAEMSLAARTLADGSGLVSNHEFFL